MIEWRNPTYNRHGGIDCEINNPDFGWIPFTVDPNDPPNRYLDPLALHDAIVVAGSIAPYVPPAVSDAVVDIERDRRIAVNFTFGGTAYDFDTASKARITGMGTLAGFAIAQGAGPGNLRWADPDNDFVWIASDNSFVPMDAPTCFAFATAAARHESAHIFAARALKDMSPIPADFTDNSYWP